MNASSTLTRGVLIVLAALVIPLSLSADAPKGWHLNGSAPTNFETGNYDLPNEGSAAYVRSTVDEVEFGGLMQKFSATAYRGKQLRLSGKLKTNNVKGWAGLWMRIDGPAQERLGFDAVGEDTVVTGDTASELPAVPANLNFDE